MESRPVLSLVSEFYPTRQPLVTESLKAQCREGDSNPQGPKPAGF